MIGSLKGTITEISGSYCILETSGVGYLVLCSAKTLGKLQEGEGAHLLIETVVREDAINLYGFLTAEEKTWFSLLTGKVSGVGARMGMAILSALSPGELFSAIASRDKSMLTQADGVGNKLAERIITELKDKTSSFTLPQGAVSSGTEKNSQVEDAVSALVNLGYKRAAAFETVWAVYNAGGNKLDTADLVRMSLRKLTTRD